MQVILLERIPKLGQMGDEVSVKPGYARNFLLPQGKALRATEANRKRFEAQKAQLEARNLELKAEAEAVHEKLHGEFFVIIRQAGDSGQLYGSVTTRDVANSVTEGGYSLERRQVVLDRPIKTLGLHEIMLVLHPEVETKITLNVARSEEEAERQARGEDVTQTADEGDEEPAANAEDMFEDEEAARAAQEALSELPDADEQATSSGKQEATESAPDQT